MHFASRFSAAGYVASLLFSASFLSQAQQLTFSAAPQTMAAVTSATTMASGVSSSTDLLPDVPDAQEPVGQTVQDSNTTRSEANESVPVSKQQPKRILGLMPNYRAVSAGAIPPPPGPKRAFKIATLNSFDYSSFVFVGLTSMIAEGEDAHPKLGKGVPGFWAYSWRGFVDKTDGNYWVIFALPTVFHEDERFYAKGEGPILKRGVYAASRIFITPDYSGNNTINASELLGRGIAQGISTTYYPSTDRTVSSITTKYAYALLRDAATNTFREFWPDIAAHLGHHSSE